MSNLEAFAENIWLVDGPLVRDMGITFTTRMSIIKLSDGSLWLSSPVPVSFETLERISELGPVRYLVAATPRHVWRLDRWHTLFPDAQLWASRPTPLTLQKGPLPLTGVLGDVPSAQWAGDLDQFVFKGNPLLSEVLFYHQRASTVLLDDLIQSNPILEGHPWRNSLLKLGGVLYPDGGVPFDMRLSFTRRALARQSIEKLLSWDFDKLVIAHGTCIEENAKQYVERAFRWLVH